MCSSDLYVFMKNFQHYPDMGDDIDLLVMDDKDKADQAIVKRLAAKPCRLSFLNQFGGKTQYSFDNNPICVEIHHGRMGRVGEHAIFPRFLMKNRVSAHLGGVCVFVPKPEDQFIIQVLQRVYGRLYLRISELAYSIAAMYRADLDWNYIVETSRVIGIYPGLG